MRFINNLPSSLEQLYLEINSQGVCCDEDEGFDVLCNLGTQIFAALRRLHTCDIHAWISNYDGGLGWTPQKGVFYRRLPNDGNKVKDIWTSRMDCIYQGQDRTHSTECTQLALDDGEGEFEGRDAEEIWLHGYEFMKAQTSTMGGSPPSEQDFFLAVLAG